MGTPRIIQKLSVAGESPSVGDTERGALPIPGVWLGAWTSAARLIPAMAIRHPRRGTLPWPSGATPLIQGDSLRHEYCWRRAAMPVFSPVLVSESSP